MKRAAKKMSALVAVLLIAAFTLCALFIAAESAHDCCGSKCSICTSIESCLNVLTAQSFKALSCAAAQLARFAAVLVLGTVICRVFATSLVTLKIKLSY
ncbi:MAG: hypothetical protein LUH82_05240 [Clostridiales bacterium]|nr:hypothetical protein [Clostridiales bacterium]